jgi:acetyl esterase/lipase
MSAHLPAGWAAMDQAARDAAYNNAVAVKDSAALREARNRASAAVRAARPGHLDLPYGTAEREKWDLFPAAVAEAPCLVFVHGGYWQMNAREDFAALVEGALEAGWSAALPGYTLAPEASLTRIVEELHRALDWLAAEGPAHGIRGRVVLSGWSAGGHLVAMGLGHPVVAAGLAISGIFELAPVRDTYLDAALKLTEAELAALSPQRLPVVPKPCAVVYGSAELPELVRQSRDFHALRAAAHAPGPLVPVPGADHFRVLDSLRSGGSLLRLAEELLR